VDTREINVSKEKNNTNKKSTYHKIKISDIKPDENITIKEENYFYGLNCVVTGEFTDSSREDVLKMLVNVGAVIKSAVSSKTNVLIVGDLENVNTVQERKSTKLIRAEELPNAIQFVHQTENKHKNEFLIQFFEEDYPPDHSGSNSGVIKSILRIKEDTAKAYKGCILVGMQEDQFSAAPVPESAIMVLGTEESKTRSIRFMADDPSMLEYIKEQILYKYHRYRSNNTFGCCSSFIKCSDATKCLH